MTATRLVITGTWVTETDTPASGRIQFQANDVGFVNGGELVRAGVQGYALDKTGSISVSLIRCPDGYTVTEQINGAYKRSYILPDQVGPVDLRDVIIPSIGIDPVHATGGGEEVVSSIANANSAATLDLSIANVFVVRNPTSGGTCILTLTGATAGKACGGSVIFVQRASGNSGLAFAGGTIIPMNDGGLPGPAQVANAEAEYSFRSLDGGVTWKVWKVGDSAAVAPPAVPDAPTAVTAVHGNSQLVVSFTPGASNGSARIGCRITPYIAGVAQTPQTFASTATTQTLTDLTNGTTYTVTVEDENGVGFSPPSAASSAATPATVPGPPTGVVGTPGNTQGSIAFTPPASNGGAPPLQYTVTVNPGGHTATGSSSPIVVTGLTNGVVDTATVHATNSEGNSVESTASAPFTPAAGPTFPDAPTIGTATAGNGVVTVTHTPNGNGGAAITGCEITPYIAGVAQTPQTFMDTATTHNVTATNGVTYTYKVAEINSVGTGARSAASNAATPIGPGAADNFNRANGALGTSSGGQTWVIGGGTWTVDTNRATAADASGVVAVVETSLADGTGQVTCLRSDNAVGADQQLVFRYIDANNYLFIQIQGAGTGSASRICKKDSGTISVLADGAGGTWSVAAPATIKAVVTGSVIDYYVNGTLNVSHTLTGPEQTKYGAATKWGLAGGWLNFVGGWFDDFSVVA